EVYMQVNTIPEQLAKLTQERYLPRCYNCELLFDATDAIWCDCLTEERSLVCPHCLLCFCKSVKEYKDRFWANAPQDLWDQRYWRNRISITSENIDPGLVKRPLVLVVDDEGLIH